MSISPKGCFDTKERPFVDRGTYIQAFENALNNLEQKDYSILVYFGIGGIGKTSLRKELLKLLEKCNEYKDKLDVIWAYVDFSIESHQQPDKFLVILKNQLREKYGVNFHLFDIGHAAYWRKVNPQVPLLRESYSEESIVTDLLDIFGGFVSINYSSVKRIVELTPYRFKEWALKREKEIANIVDMEAVDIGKNLPAFWASDLTDYLKSSSNSAVIFIDTYEALWDNHRAQGDFNSKDKWIRDLVAELPGVLWVICGREALSWEETDPDWKEYLEQNHIGKLPEKDAIDLLNICGVGDEKIQKIILDGSKGVPYYLDLAIDTYNQIKKKRQPVPDDFAKTPADIFNMFIKYLDKQEIETLKVLSAPRVWDYYLFEVLIKKFNTGYPLTAFSDMKRFSFTSQNSDGKWYMHQLMRESLQDYQNSDLKNRVHRFIFEHYNEKLKDINIKNVKEEHKNALVEGFYHAEIVLEMPELLDWLITISEPFKEAALWYLLLPLHEEMLRMQETKLPPEHPDIATTLYEMALLTNKIGKYKDALQLYQRALEIRKKTMKHDDPYIADTLNGMAWVSFKIGEFENALTLYQQALEVREKVLGSEHPDVAKILDNKAALLKNMGKYYEALPLYQRALEIREKVFGKEHRYVASNLNNLAILYSALGKYDQSLLLHLESLAIKEKVIGKENPSVSITLNNMSVLYMRLGKYKEALLSCQEALEIREKALGPSHPSIAANLSNLAEIYLGMGMDEEALSLCKQALEIRENALGPSHPSIAYELNTLAKLYQKKGMCEEALSTVCLALEIRKKTMKPDNPYIADTLNIMAGIYECMGKSETALSTYKQVLDIREKVLGPEHPNVAKTLVSMAEIYKNLGESDKALLLYQHALNISEKVLGSEHPDVVKTLTMLNHFTNISKK